MQAGAAATTQDQRINYVLIDYENVQPPSVQLLDREDVRVWVFVGASQKSLSTDLVTQMQALGTRAGYVRCSGNGANALDFHIAYYIGQLTRDDPDGFFHIISKDTGFDPLVAHLKQRKIRCARSTAIVQMPLFKSNPITATALHASARLVVETAAERLQKTRISLEKMPKKARPAKLTSLQNHVAARFQKSIGANEVTALILGLQDTGILQVNGSKVSYT